MSQSSGVDFVPELVKFSWEQVSSKTPAAHDVEHIRRVCSELHKHDLVTPYRPPAVVGSNGNVSYRHTAEGGFVVTATQLASKQDLCEEDFVTVDRYEFPASGSVQGKAFYNGAKLPSSESILHWHLYRRFPEIGAILHVHELTSLLYDSRSQSVWKELGIVETARAGEAGSIDLPRSVKEVLVDLRQYTILKHHYPPWDEAHTGIVVLGRDLDEALERVLNVHRVLVSANAMAK